MKAQVLNNKNKGADEDILWGQMGIGDTVRCPLTKTLWGSPPCSVKGLLRRTSLHRHGALILLAMYSCRLQPTSLLSNDVESKTDYSLILKEVEGMRHLKRAFVIFCSEVLPCETFRPRQNRASVRRGFPIKAKGAKLGDVGVILF
jgi:hypothetical protein